jgi:hypothetical protein
LVPAVAASLKNTVPAFRPIKKPRLTHDPSTMRIYHIVPLLVCGQRFSKLQRVYFLCVHFTSFFIEDSYEARIHSEIRL